MNAKIGNRFQEADRVRLEEVIPLSTPYLIFIDPSSICNFKCTFCPCGGGNKQYWDKEKKTGLMSYSLYRSVIDQLKDFPEKIKTLRLYKEGEPLLNKRLPDMIRYAKDKDVARVIDFTTNGSLLTEDLNFALLDSGIDRINVSVEALDEEGYLKHAGVPIEMKRFRQTLNHLYLHKGACHLMIKITDIGLSSHSEKEFYEYFGEFCDEISVERVTPVWPGFGLDHVKSGFQEGLFGKEIHEREVCPYLFYSMCVNSDGSVSSCFVDWNHKNIVGNCQDNRLLDIWNQAGLTNMRKTHLSGGRHQNPICASCGQLTYAALDNLDPYKENIRKRLGL